MVFINYGGETVALCLALPDWAEDISVEIDLSSVTDVTKSRTAIRSPRKFARSSRYSFEFTVGVPGPVTVGDEARYSTRLRLWLQRLKGETVAVPMWMDGVEISSAITAGDIVLNKTSDNPVQYGAEWIILDPLAQTYEIVVVNAIDGSTVTLTSGTSLNWPAGTFMFPLLFGRLTKRPSFDSDTDEVLNGKIGFQENSTFARQLNIFPGTIPVVGANVPDFAATPLWDIQPDEETKSIDTSEVDILYKSIGFLRQDQQYVYPQAVRRGLELNVYRYTRDDIAKVTRLFIDRYAGTKTFMMPTFRGDMRLTTDLPPIAVYIPLLADDGSPLLADDGSALMPDSGIAVNQIIVEPGDFTDPTRPSNPGDPYIALVDPAGVDCQKIRELVGNTLYLTGTVSTSHSMSNTKLSHLLLCVFADTKLSWSYKTDGQAQCKVKVLEVPDQYQTPQADLPQPGYLFQFTEQMPTPLVSRFTSYEDALVLAAGGPFDGNYTPAPFDFPDSGSETGLKLDEEKLDITSWDFDSTLNPLRKVLDYSLEGVLHVDVLEADRNNLTAAPDIIFSGDFAGLVPNGKDWKATFRAFGQFFQRQFPRAYFSKICLVHLFSPKCGLNKADFLTPGTLFAFGSGGAYIDIAQIGGDPDPAAQPAHYFAIGRFETGAGYNYETRMITDSVIVSGKLRLYFAKPLKKAVLNQNVNIYPGCNGSVASCISFGNLINMRATPYIPDKNPTTDAGLVPIASGGKK